MECLFRICLFCLQDIRPLQLFPLLEGQTCQTPIHEGIYIYIERERRENGQILWAFQQILLLKVVKEILFKRANISVFYLQELAQRADRWSADWTVALYFKSWSDLTLQRRLHKQRRQEAQGYNQLVISFAGASFTYFFYPANSW